MRPVKVILREDVPTLGFAGELVSVKPGYARNYLVPRGKALLATESNLRELEHYRRVVADKVVRERRSLEAERDRIEAVALEIEALAGEEGKLFGSVTTTQIAERLAQLGVEVDRRHIQLEQPIKQLGEHNITIRVHRDLVANLRLNVVAAS